jgi:hypothetical protein
MVSNELGLVMFKDAREEDTPAAYGKLLPEFERQVGAVGHEQHIIAPGTACFSCLQARIAQG